FILCFFYDTATTEIYTLSLHDALPILLRVTARDRLCLREVVRIRDCPYFAGLVLLLFSREEHVLAVLGDKGVRLTELAVNIGLIDRKSTRLNSSHLVISYAVFCLKKKK